MKQEVSHSFSLFTTTERSRIFLRIRRMRGWSWRLWEGENRGVDSSQGLLSWKGVFPLSAIISTTPTCRKQKTCCWTRMCCIRLMAFLYSSGARWSCWVWVITAWKLFPMRFLLVCPSIVDFRVDNIGETQFGRQQAVWIPFRPIQSPFSPLPSAVWKPLVLSARFFKSLSTFGGIVRGQVCADCFCSLSPSL